MYEPAMHTNAIGANELELVTGGTASSKTAPTGFGELAKPPEGIKGAPIGELINKPWWQWPTNVR